MAARYSSQNGWYLDTATRRLTVNGRGQAIIDGGTITLFGRERHPLPVADDDEIRLDQEWVMYTALANLCAHHSPQHDRWGVEYMQKAAGREAFVVPAYHPNAVYIPESSS